MALIVDGAAVAELLRSPDGPMGRHMIRKATVFQAAARAQIAPHRKSGCLEDTIVKRLVEIDGHLAVRVISDTSPCSPTRTSYSLFVHEGTQPHPIFAKNGGLLRFFWANGPQGAGVYFFRSVNHPGTKPIRFLTDNLPIFAS